jgi:hypothetical protein
MQFAEKLGFIEKNSLIVGPFLASHAVAEDAQTVMIFKRRSQHDNERKELATISRRSQWFDQLISGGILQNHGWEFHSEGYDFQDPTSEFHSKNSGIPINLSESFGIPRPFEKSANPNFLNSVTFST